METTKNNEAAEGDETGDGDGETSETEAGSSTKEPESTPVRKKVTTIIRPNEKRSVPRSQLQALANLATGVNKMADTNAKRLKMQVENEKDKKKERDALLDFRREEAEANRRHELALAQIYVQVLNQSQPPPQQARPSNSMDMPFWPNASPPALPMRPHHPSTHARFQNHQNYDGPSNNWYPDNSEDANNSKDHY